MLGFVYYILLTMIYFSTLTKTIRLYSIIIYFELKRLEKNNRRDWFWIREVLTFIELLPSFTTDFLKSRFLTQESTLLLNKVKPSLLQIVAPLSAVGGKVNCGSCTRWALFPPCACFYSFTFLCPEYSPQL